MTKKVTENDLKKLIEEVLKEEQLNEKTKFVTKDGKGIFDDGKWDSISKARKDLDWGTKPVEKDWNRLKGLVNDTDVDGVEPLSFKDLEAAAGKQSGINRNAFNTLKADLKTAITGGGGSTGTLVDPGEFKVGNTTKANKGLGVYEPNSIAFGQMANVGMQSPDDKVGAIQLGIGTAMKEFFANKTTFKSRIDAISTFTKAVFVSGDLPTKKVELLRATLVADYLSTIVKEIDSGSGAYQFESFLAAMAGGSVVGKGTIDGTGTKKSGKMGAVDFVTADGSFGSAKYYSQATSLTQAIGGFKNMKNKTTLYVIAIKKTKQEGNQRSGDDTTSQPDAIQVLDIYMVSIMPTKKTPTKASDFEIQINGETKGAGKMSSTANQMYIQRSVDDDGEETMIGSSSRSEGGEPIKLYIAGAGGETLRAKLKDATKSDTTGLKDAYTAFESLFKNLYTANQNAQAYASSGDKDQGNEALSTLQTSDQQLIDLVKLITTDNATDTFDASARTIKEQKITANFLKKLIEESFKK